MKLPKPFRISNNQSNSISSFNQSVGCAFVQLISRPVEVDSFPSAEPTAAARFWLTARVVSRLRNYVSRQRIRIRIHDNCLIVQWTYLLTGFTFHMWTRHVKITRTRSKILKLLDSVQAQMWVDYSVNYSVKKRF